MPNNVVYKTDMMIGGNKHNSEWELVTWTRKRVQNMTKSKGNENKWERINSVEQIEGG